MLIQKLIKLTDTLSDFDNLIKNFNEKAKEPIILKIVRTNYETQVNKDYINFTTVRRIIEDDLMEQRNKIMEELSKYLNDETIKELNGDVF